MTSRVNGDSITLPQRQVLQGLFAHTCSGRYQLHQVQCTVILTPLRHETPPRLLLDLRWDNGKTRAALIVSLLPEKSSMPSTRTGLRKSIIPITKKTKKIRPGRSPAKA